MAEYVSDAAITVKLVNNYVSILGEVRAPGRYPIYKEQMNIFQAIAMAGGMTPFAAVNKIKIVRRKGEELEAYSFKFSDIEKGENLGQNIVLRSGDIVVVP